jgi:hypothetical protein
VNIAEGRGTVKESGSAALRGVGDDFFIQEKALIDVR